MFFCRVVMFSFILCLFFFFFFNDTATTEIYTLSLHDALPIAVRERLEPFLPVPAVVREGDTFRLDYERPKTIGKVRGFCGPFGVFVRSYAYIRSYGPALKEMSEVAVLNANYLLARLK